MGCRGKTGTEGGETKAAEMRPDRRPESGDKNMPSAERTHTTDKLRKGEKSKKIRNMPLERMKWDKGVTTANLEE